MTEILSQDEIDALLSAIQTGEIAPDEIKKEEERRKIKMYDFRRPDKFSKDQIRTLTMIHETFARLATTTLSALLRLVVNLHVAAVDQLTYEEFIRSVPGPTTLAILVFDPLNGNAVLQIDPQLTSAMIDRLFGGKGDPAKINRELTDIEVSVMEGVITRLLNNLKDAWQNVIPDFKPRLWQIESNPQFVQVVPPNDMVVLVTIEMSIGTAEGTMNLCIPYITIEPVVGKLSAQYWYSGVVGGQTPEYAEKLRNRLNQIYSELIAELGYTHLTLREILNLKRGDIVILNQKVSDDIIVRVAGRPKYWAKAGKVGKKLGVKITGVITPEEEEIIEEKRGGF